MFPLLSSALCVLWLNRGFLLNLGAGLLTTGMPSFQEGDFCMRWGLEHSNKEMRAIGIVCVARQKVETVQTGGINRVLAISMAYRPAWSICSSCSLENKTKNKVGDIVDSNSVDIQKFGGGLWTGSLPEVLTADMTSVLS